MRISDSSQNRRRATRNYHNLGLDETNLALTFSTVKSVAPPLRVHVQRDQIAVAAANIDAHSGRLYQSLIVLLLFSSAPCMYESSREKLASPAPLCVCVLRCEFDADRCMWLSSLRLAECSRQLVAVKSEYVMKPLGVRRQSGEETC